MQITGWTAQAFHPVTALGEQAYDIPNTHLSPCPAIADVELPMTYLQPAAKKKSKTKKENLSFNLLPSEKICIIQPSFSAV